ncbi:conserved hypothetical protein [Ricinus communis]|uniref:Uncharacterized protein n=1 Tax=Ricinus communis TaxID=3988 RepID=B9RZG6_RICCO|nr:conserved hypothetical protein [Ricinus communis]
MQDGRGGNGNESATCEQEREIFVGLYFDSLVLRLSPESKRARFYACVQYVPAAFSNKYLNWIPRGKKIKLRNSDEKQWQREWFVRILRRDYGGKGGLSFRKTAL